jgi:hypothetical protein
MVAVATLWLPILVSAALVFVVSSIIHMALGYHSADFKKLPSENEVMEALRKFNIPPGDYLMPRPSSARDMKDPAFIERRTKGPLAFMTVGPSGPPSMGSSLIQWFLHSILIGIFSAYVAGRALGPGAPYLSVFRFAGCTAFAGYSLGQMQGSIWYWKSWGTTFRNMFDGLVYALVTAGAFGWLWPR